MKTLFLILALLIVAPAEAARFYRSPEIPNVTCADGIDNDADGTYDAADSDCAAAATLATDGGNGYRGNFKDAIVTGFTTAADTTAGSGTYLKKSSNSSGFYIGEGALHASFTNATYYAWMRYRCSETQCAAWFSSSPIRGSVNNATQGMILTNQPAFTWIQVQYAGSNANFRNGLNGGGNQTFALNGNGAIFFKATDGLELDCFVLDPDAGATPDCPDTGSGQPTVHYTILELGAESTPTDWNSAAFTHANVMTFQGYDNTNLTCTVKMLWDNAATDRLYISTDCNDTDDEIVSVAEDSFSTSEDNVDFRWRLDTTQTFDSSMRMVVGNLQPVFADADWSGVDNARTFTPDFNTTVAKTVTASTSWQSFIAIDAGAVTADTIGLCNLVIRDKDAGTATTLKHLYGTTNNAMLNANEFANCKWSSTTVPASGGGGDVTAPTVSNTAETNLTATSATITFDTNEAGTAFVVYGTATGDYTFTSSTSACSASCVIALTGLTAGTTYYYRAKVTDAANNTGQSAEDTAATAASTATLFVANAAAGSGNCSSAANACRFATVWASTVPGSIIEATAGTYTGANSMITPPSGLNGTAANRITVRCATDGACTIDGQNARRPVLLNNNDYFTIDGFNAHSSNTSVVSLGTGADNNIIRNFVAWDANENDNASVFSVSSNTGNLLQDTAGFGKGRKIYSIILTSNLTIRRAWGVWQKNLIVGPKITFTNDYDSSGATFENLIGSWNSQMGATGVNQPIGILGTDGNTPPGECNNNHYYASLAYLRSTDVAVSFDGLARSNNDSDCAKFQDIVTYIEPGTHTNLRPVSLLNISGATATQRFYTNATEIGGTTASTVGSQWTTTNRKTYASVAAMDADSANPFQTTSGNGARMCFRTEAGVLTSTKLWPWPMDDRINAALTASGRTPSDYLGGSGNTVTSHIESIFGTIPAGCKS